MEIYKKWMMIFWVNVALGFWQLFTNPFKSTEFEVSIKEIKKSEVKI